MGERGGEGGALGGWRSWGSSRGLGSGEREEVVKYWEEVSRQGLRLRTGWGWESALSGCFLAGLGGV